MENTNINDAAIKRSNIPNNWSYCFNSNCKRCNECIHFRSSVALDPSRTQGNAIFPIALRADGSCDHFKPVRMVRLASGFKQLFEDVKLRDASNLRLLMRKYFGVPKYVLSLSLWKVQARARAARVDKAALRTVRLHERSI